MASAGRILITGGAGFIGTHLVGRLRERGDQVTVLDNLSEQVHGGKPWPPPDGVELLRGDVRDRQAVRCALRGVDRIVHLAAETGVGQSAYEIERYVDVNERGTAVLLEECAKVAGDLRGLVLASSRAVYGEGRYLCPTDGEVYPGPRSQSALQAGEWEPVCPRCGGQLDALPAIESQRLYPASVYAATKLNQEHLLGCFARSQGVRCTALRFQNVYGPGQALGNPYTGIVSIFATRLLNENAIEVYEDGAPSRDFIYMADATQAIAIALSSFDHCAEGTRVFNVGSGRSTSVLSLAKLLADLLDRKNLVEVTGRYRVGDIRHAWADMSRFVRRHSCPATTSLEEGLRTFVVRLADQDCVIDGSGRAEQELLLRGLMGRAKVNRRVCRGSAMEE